jgi:amidase
MFEDSALDLVLCPGDSPLCLLSSATGLSTVSGFTKADETGYPIGTVPLGQLQHNGRPFGLCIMGKAGGESAMIRFMKNWEALMPARPVPELVQ